MTEPLKSRLVRTTDTVNAILQTSACPGASVAIAKAGETIYQANYGVRDGIAGQPPDEHTLFQICSITKSITAAAIGILVHQGKLDWTTPVRDVLPAFKSVSSIVTSEATVVDLLAHRTGISGAVQFFMGAEGQCLCPQQDELACFNALHPVCGFREEFVYNNYGYAVAGLIIEQLSGRSWRVFISENILDPLGMHDTTDSVDRIHASTNIAMPYAGLDGGDYVRLPHSLTRSDTAMAPAMSLRSSAHDMTIWANALMTAARHESRTGSQETPGSPLKYVSYQFESKIALDYVSSDVDRKSYSLGLCRFDFPTTLEGAHAGRTSVAQMPIIRLPRGRSESLTAILHSGNTAGYAALFIMVPELDTSIVVLTNGLLIGDPSMWIAHVMLEAVLDSPGSAVNDYVALASESAERHRRWLPDLHKQLDKEKRAAESHASPTMTTEGTTADPSAIVGTYKHPVLDLIIVIRRRQAVANETGRDGSAGVDVLFQGLESQTWAMTHHHGDRWHFLPSGGRDEMVRRGVESWFVTTESWQLIFDPPTAAPSSEREAERQRSGVKMASVVWPFDECLSHNVQKYHRCESPTHEIP